YTSTSTSPSRPLSAPGCGNSTTVRDGCRSARPLSTSSAASTHSGGTQAVCVITLVRWYGDSTPGTVRSDASSRSMSRTVVNACATTAPPAAPTSGNRRPGSLERSMPPPGPPVSAQQLVGGGWAPGAGRIVRERRPVARPRGDDRVDERPLLVDLVDAREERRVTEHRVKNQPLVRLGEPGAERPAVEEVHVHRANRHALARHLRADRERHARVRLHVPEHNARPQAFGGQLFERRMRCAL